MVCPLWPHFAPPQPKKKATTDCSTHICSWNKWQHSDINCLFQHTVVAEPFFQSIRWVPFLNVGKKKFLVRSQAARSSLELNVLRELSFSWRKASANEFQGMCICMRFPPRENRPANNMRYTLAQAPQNRRNRLLNCEIINDVMVLDLSFWSMLL